MSIWGNDALERWPVGVVWFASYLVYLGTAYGTKATYRSSINAFNIIFSSLGIRSPFARSRSFPPRQVDMFLALATMASYKAASTVRVAKCAAEDAWLLTGNIGPVIDAVLWKRMYKGIKVYKGTSLKEKTAILPSQIRRKIEHIMQGRKRIDIDSASVILADLCGALLGLRRSEFLASAERNPNRTTLLCFQGLSGLAWDLADRNRSWDIAT